MSVAARRQREREERRSHILDAAQRAFLERGIDAVTMDDIAGEAEVAKGTLYLYFKNKDDLAMGLALRNQQHLLQRFGEATADAVDGRDLLRRLLLAMLHSWTDQNPGHLRLWLGCLVTDRMPDPSSNSYQEHARHVQRTFNTVLGAIERGKHDRSLCTDRPSADLALQLWGAMLGMLMLHALEDRIRERLDSAIRASDLAHAQIDLLLTGLAGSTSKSQEARP